MLWFVVAAFAGYNVGVLASLKSLVNNHPPIWFSYSLQKRVLKPKAWFRANLNVSYQLPCIFGIWLRNHTLQVILLLMNTTHSFIDYLFIYYFCYFFLFILFLSSLCCICLRIVQSYFFLLFFLFDYIAGSNGRVVCLLIVIFGCSLNAVVFLPLTNSTKAHTLRIDFVLFDKLHNMRCVLCCCLKARLLAQVMMTI